MILRSVSALLTLCCLSLACAGCSANRGALEHEAFIQSQAFEADLTRTCGRASDIEGSPFLAALAGRLAPAVSRRAREPRFVRWEIVRCTQPFANSLGDGRVLLSLGQLHAMKSEGELAFVSLHELSHELLKHPSAVLTPSSRSLPEQRQELELEADELAVQLLAFAGYDPRVAVSLLERLAQRPQRDTSPFHPEASLRAAKLIELINKSGWQPPGRVNSRDFQLFALSIERYGSGNPS